MKTLIVKENTHGRQTKINAKNTYQTEEGNWVAEVDEEEMKNACYALYRGLKDCTIKDLHVEADKDDDGKEYIISSG